MIGYRELVGKTIAKIDRCVYSTKMTIEFTDGTILSLSAGSTGSHNDRWSTVEYTIKQRDDEVVQ